MVNGDRQKEDLMALGKRIRQARSAKNLSQEALAEKVGTSKSVISGYETGRNDPAQSAILKLAEALDVSINWLMGAAVAPQVPPVTGVFPIKIKRLPLLGDIACGKPIYANEDRESYIEVGTDLKADFCLRAKGDSMINARIFDGDIVFIRAQSAVQNGEIAVVIIDDEATLKRVFYYPELDTVELRAENPTIAPLVYKGSELEAIHILGKAIAFQADVV